MKMRLGCGLVLLVVLLDASLVEPATVAGSATVAGLDDMGLCHETRELGNWDLSTFYRIALSQCLIALRSLSRSIRPSSSIVMWHSMACSRK